MNHEQIQPLLTLSAAGLLDVGGERAVREHARQCRECAAQLAGLSALSAALASRPAPEMPDALMLRAHALVSAELALLSERRRSVWFVAVAVLVAWILNLATWAVFHWWHAELSGVVVWLVLSALTASVAAPAALAIAASRRRAERRI